MKGLTDASMFGILDAVSNCLKSIVALMLIVSACGPDSEAEKLIEMRSGVDDPIEWQDETFLMTVMRGATERYPDGNQLKSLESHTKNNTPFVEVDFRLTQDAKLVSMHHEMIEGCGLVSALTLSALLACPSLVGTPIPLSDLIAMDFPLTMIDLKPTADSVGDGGIADAVSQILDADAQERVILFVYDLSPESQTLLEDSGVLYGLKGYPAPDAFDTFLERSESIGASFICIRAGSVSEEGVDAARLRGIEIIAWERALPENLAHFRRLSDHGLRGLITTQPDFFGGYR